MRRKSKKLVPAKLLGASRGVKRRQGWTRKQNPYHKEPRMQEFDYEILSKTPTRTTMNGQNIHPANKSFRRIRLNSFGMKSPSGQVG